jgi:hypothetical protein
MHTTMLKIVKAALMAVKTAEVTPNQNQGLLVEKCVLIYSQSVKLKSVVSILSQISGVDGEDEKFKEPFGTAESGGTKIITGLCTVFNISYKMVKC